MKQKVETTRGDTVVITFHCSKCNSKDFYRDAEVAKTCATYLEGYFNCSGCHREVVYYDDDLKVSHNSHQAELFVCQTDLFDQE